ncbi:MAG TPA: glycosyltransferase family 4 protein [Trebonia sp.]
MRVLALTHAYLPNHCAGAETMLHSMLRVLAGAGHEVQVVLSTQRGDPYEIDGIRVYPRMPQREMLEHLTSAHLIVSQLANAPVAAALGKWNRVPVVILAHNNFTTHYKAILAPQGEVALMVVNSQWVADDFAGWLRWQKPKTICRAPQVLIHHPLPDAADCATAPGDRVTLVNMSVDGDGPDGLRLGKGGELFRRLAERMPETTFLGVTGGYGRQQDMRGLANAVVLPHVPHEQMREQVWSRTRILLVPSAYESWGRVASEAICSGIPVIAHPTAGLVENLGPAGIFVDRDDVDGWVNELRRLAIPDEYAAASAAAGARAAEQQLMRAAEEAAWLAATAELGAVLV